jgi:acyl dehydratase
MADEANQPLITDEMRQHIGQRSEPTTLEVDRTMVRLFARAVGHTDPVFYDVEAAKKAGYRDLPAPPGYLGTPVYNPGAERRAGANPQALKPSRPLNRILNGGTEYEYHKEICAGDVLTSESYVSDLAERKGGIGDMLIVTSKTEYKDQNGDLAAVMTGTLIRY